MTHHADKPWVSRPPSLVVRHSEKTKQSVEQLFDGIASRNTNTASAYFYAVDRFLRWCRDRGLGLQTIRPSDVLTYIEQHVHNPAEEERTPASTMKQHLAAIRKLFAHLFKCQIVREDPTISVPSPRVAKRIKTSVLNLEQVQALLDSIGSDTIVGLRDRAIIGLMFCAPMGLGEVLAMRIDDYHRYQSQRQQSLGFKNMKVFVDAYVTEGDIRTGLLFRSVDKHRQLTNGPITRTVVLRMVKRRAEAAGLDRSICCRAIRTAGILAHRAERPTRRGSVNRPRDLTQGRL